MISIQKIKTILLNQQGVSIYLIWVFHLSAMIGITLGFQDWFMPKTPLNLSLIFVLLLWSFPVKPLKFWLAILVFFCGGMLLEWVGVHYGFLFGDYRYGANLGPKLDGIPYFIGINWAVLTLMTGVISDALLSKKSEANHSSATMVSKVAPVFLGASLMVFLDFFLEFSAPIFDFWTFEGGLAPFQNYVAWFGFSLLFHIIYQSLRLKGDTLFAYHLYAVHLVFFGYFYLYFYV